MELQVWSFSKKRKSTKIPSGAGVTINADLKHSTSFENPIFRISGSEIVGITPANITYVKDVDHGNYYFVENCTVWPHDVYELNCVMDPMASHRTEILGSTQFVVYSASNYDVKIADPRIVRDDLFWHYDSAFIPDINTTGNMHIDNVGCYILTVCNASHATNFVTTYLMNRANVQALAYFLFTVNQWPSNFESRMISLFGDAFGCIISLIWLPIDYATAGAECGGYGDIELGNFTITGVSGYLVHPGDRVKIQGSLTHTWHYQNDWRISPPYTKGLLYIPGYGVVDCNPLENEYVMVDTTVDLMTGDTVTAYGQGNYGHITVSYSLAVTVPIAQLSNNVQPAIAQIASGAFNTAMSGATGNVSGMLQGFAGNIQTAIDAMKTTPSYKGGYSGAVWLGRPNYQLIEMYMDTTDLDSLKATQGRPLMQEVTLSTLSGYCQCAEAQVSLDCYAGERAEIEGILNSGFYIE